MVEQSFVFYTTSTKKASWRIVRKVFYPEQSSSAEIEAAINKAVEKALHNLYDKGAIVRVTIRVLRTTAEYPYAERIFQL